MVKENSRPLGSSKLSSDEITVIIEQMSKATPDFTVKELAEMYNVGVGTIYYHHRKAQGLTYRYDPNFKAKNSIEEQEEVASITVAPSIPADTVENDTLATLIFIKNEYQGAAMETEQLGIQIRNHLQAIDTVIDELEHQQLLDRVVINMHSLQSKLAISEETIKTYKAQAESSRAELLAYKNRPTFSD
tara:strand:+ start:363 stop:929 length:567 start_codon:yes stop_codon:yes gene_type:complete